MANMQQEIQVVSSVDVATGSVNQKVKQTHIDTIKLDSLPKPKAGSVRSVQVNSQGSLSIDQHVLSAPSSLLEDNSVAPKRKRGRPPKPKTTPTSQVMMTDVIQDSNSLPKRKRGRPRKPKTTPTPQVVTSETTDVIQLGINSPPKRKRGRPLKPKTTPIPQLVTSETTDVIQGINSPPKRKRGRPLKPKTTPTSQVVTSETTDVIQDPPKRKRGRPPKSKPLLDSESISVIDDVPLKRKRGRPRKNKTCTLEIKSGYQSNAVNPCEVVGREEEAVTIIEIETQQASSVSVDSVNAESKESSNTKEKPTKRSKSKKRKPKAYKTTEEVHKLLERCGIDDPRNVCMCIKAGIMNGFVHLVPASEDPTGVHGLDQVIARGSCNACSGKVKATLRQLLYQGNIGWDYGDASPNAKVFCPNDCGGIYVGGFCKGEVNFDCGKFYNHCAECPNFGVCIYDYRNIHCAECGNHFFCPIFEDPSCPDCAYSDSGDESTDPIIGSFLSALLGVFNQ